MTSVSNFETLIHKFKENSITHPNISHFWVTYLELKKKSFETLLEQGLSVISQIQPINKGEESSKNDDDNAHNAYAHDADDDADKKSMIKDIEIKDLINMMIIKMIL
jgi:hypothetical protein